MSRTIMSCRTSPAGRALAWVLKAFGLFATSTRLFICRENAVQLYLRTMFFSSLHVGFHLIKASADENFVGIVAKRRGLEHVALRCRGHKDHVQLRSTEC